ncbi:17300_t:CDS:1, partial [Racocetra fulgida]
KEECGDIIVSLCIRMSDNSKKGRCKDKLTEIDLNNKENGKYKEGKL